MISFIAFRWARGLNQESFIGLDWGDTAVKTNPSGLIMRTYTEKQPLKFEHMWTCDRALKNPWIQQVTHTFTY